MAWSPSLYELWQPVVRRQVNMFLLMLRRGRALRSQPEKDPQDLFADALPVDVGLWVLR